MLVQERQSDPTDDDKGSRGRSWWRGRRADEEAKRRRAEGIRARVAELV